MFFDGYLEPSQVAVKGKKRLLILPQQPLLFALNEKNTCIVFI